MQSPASAPVEGRAKAAPAVLERLDARDFRNFPSLQLELPDAGVMMVGPNGSGKTNLLEAIYYLEIFRSFRGARDADLIRFGQDVFRIEATIRKGGERADLAAAYQRSGRRKKVEVDGTEAARLADALGVLGAVVFSLEDAELVYGSPGRRRRFLDILLSVVQPGYLASLQRYRAVLTQRNEALRQGDNSVVQAWTEGLVEPGAAVMACREAWVEGSSEAFGTYNAEIRWAELFRQALSDSMERDRRRGTTTAGPHRDDLVIRASVDTGDEQRDLRSYGSGGQQRTAAIALRLVEADTLRERLGHDPVYLLDDVFAELDRERAERVVRLLDEGRSGQVLLTAPKPADVPLRGGGLARWRIRDGVLFTDG
jgi:DNA replication and repair protein RecF